MSLRSVTALTMRQQNISEHDGIIVHLVVGRVDKREHTLPCKISQPVEFIAMPEDLRRIALAELLPADRIVSEPFAQFRAWRQLLRPIVDRRVRLLDPPGPEPVDQHARAIIGGRALIGSLQPYICSSTPSPAHCFHRYRSPCYKRDNKITALEADPTKMSDPTKAHPRGLRREPKRPPSTQSSGHGLNCPACPAVGSGSIRPVLSAILPI